jgi:hypothetical protein
LIPGRTPRDRFGGNHGEPARSDRQTIGSDNWFSEWAILAEKTTQLAADSLQSGRQFSAAKAFLRATDYWRQAIFFIRHDIPGLRLLKGWRSHRAAFRTDVPRASRSPII